MRSFESAHGTVKMVVSEGIGRGSAPKQSVQGNRGSGLSPLLNGTKPSECRAFPGYIAPKTGEAMDCWHVAIPYYSFSELFPGAYAAPKSWCVSGMIESLQSGKPCILQGFLEVPRE